MLAPLLGHAAPQAPWLSCSTHPENLVSLESSSEEWPFGSVVVVEGFISSVTVDEDQTSIAVKV